MRLPAVNSTVLAVVAVILLGAWVILATLNGAMHIAENDPPPPPPPPPEPEQEPEREAPDDHPAERRESHRRNPGAPAWDATLEKRTTDRRKNDGADS